MVCFSVRLSEVPFDGLPDDYLIPKTKKRVSIESTLIFTGVSLCAAMYTLPSLRYLVYCLCVS